MAFSTGRNPARIQYAAVIFGGMMAGLVPTGLSLPAAQDDMMGALFDQLFVQRAPTLGEAIMRAKQKMSATDPETREVIDTFVLLGDPALVNPFVIE